MNHAAEAQEREMLEAEYPSISDELESTAAKTFREILDQIDLASNIDSIYAVLSLYFPAPLDAFRLPYLVGIKQFTFGAQKPLFMFAVIVALYAYENLMQVLYSPDVQLFFANLRAGDPCFLDAGYIAQRQDILNDICEALLPLEPEFTFAATTSSAIVNNIENFEQECDCHYPMQMLFQFRSEEFPRTVMEPLEFTREVENICELAIGQCKTVYLPSTTINFLGNSSLCEDGMRACELVLQAPDSQMAGYKLWIESGLIATFVLNKFSMTNFMLSLLKLADPFVICAGRFMWIPLRFGLSLSAKDKAGLFAEFKEIKQASLWYYITVRGAVFWGGLMHWALYNLMTTAFTNSAGSGGVDNSDVTILRATLLFSGLIALAAGLVVWLLNGSRKRERDAVYSGRKSGKDSDNLDDEDESGSIKVDNDDSDESFYGSDG